ncbi:hypothetical protein W97_02871 [Coniosporium apollinis CBS 100218]|uniref:Uncharacterized protein n=1 Tax=Coniosporium apollinis (strain CBS 100218) TaxID=1168221 RepID=R7YP75_CONA1|nr:uncharacterized protein W97_02871 [Coniosporium apollinis CBS 100218]EON63643.1 hypothetical protein W97_02871 [Coniosporium apollinis CBS 100218]
MNLGDAASSQHGVNDSAGEPETLPSAASTAPVAAHHGGDSSQITAAGSGPSVQAGPEASVQVQPNLNGNDPRWRLRQAVHGVFLRVDGANYIDPPTIPAPGQSRLSVEFHRSFFDGHRAATSQRLLATPLTVDGLEWQVIPQGDNGVQFRHCQSCRDQDLDCSHGRPCIPCDTSGRFCSIINLFFDAPTTHFFYANRWMARASASPVPLYVLLDDVFGVQLQENGVPAVDWELMPASHQSIGSVAFHESFDHIFPLGDRFRASNGVQWAVINRRERGVQFRYCSSRDPANMTLDEAAPCARCSINRSYCTVVEVMFDGESDSLFAELVGHQLLSTPHANPYWPYQGPTEDQRPQAAQSQMPAPAAQSSISGQATVVATAPPTPQQPHQPQTTTAVNPPTAAVGQLAAAAGGRQPPPPGPPQAPRQVRVRFITVQGAPSVTCNPVACFLTAMEILIYFPEWLLFDECLIRLINGGWQATEMARAIGWGRGWDARQCRRYRSTIAHRIPKAGARVYQVNNFVLNQHILTPRATDFDPTTWTVAFDGVENNMTDYRLTDVLTGVQNHPTGADAGELSRCLAHQQANPGQVLWLSDIPQLLQANPTWRTNQAALGANPDNAALGRWLVNPGRSTVT